MHWVIISPFRYFLYLTWFPVNIHLLNNSGNSGIVYPYPENVLVKMITQCVNVWNTIRRTSMLMQCFCLPGYEQVFFFQLPWARGSDPWVHLSIGLLSYSWKSYNCTVNHVYKKQFQRSWSSVYWRIPRYIFTFTRQLRVANIMEIVQINIRHRGPSILISFIQYCRYMNMHIHKYQLLKTQSIDSVWLQHAILVELTSRTTFLSLGSSPVTIEPR